MHHLLHIPSGKIITFDWLGNQLSIHERAKEIQVSEYEILLAVASGDFSGNFYVSRNLPFPPILETEFEIIEVPCDSTFNG